MPSDNAVGGSNHWSVEMLEAKRKLTDPLADQTVADIITSGYEEKINEVFYKLVRNDSYSADIFSDLPTEVSAAVNKYFQATSQLPDWADQGKIKIGERVFGTYGPEISMLLNVKSLPLCYACSKGAKVLFMTGRLSEQNGSIDPLARRLMETAQMIVNAMMPGGLSSEGKGIVTMQKVRLIHASIRYFLKNPKFNKEGWDTATYGEPINQEDMAGTLMSFAALILKGLEQLNISLTTEEQNAYMHCWEIIGTMMGVDRDLIPTTYEDGWNLGIAIMSHQAEASDWGKELTNSCIAFLKYAVPGNLFDSVPEYMIWYFVQDVSEAIGKDIAPMIGVENNHSLKDLIVLKFTKLIIGGFSKAEDHSGIIQKISIRFNRLMLQGFLKHFNEGKNVHFYIPPSLQKDWKLVEEWENTATSPSILGNRLALQMQKPILYLF
ncbi:MAG: oxygenase MpaB family protein, partial [Bacteroidota bacterium]